jgi:hypothetical protein
MKPCHGTLIVIYVIVFASSLWLGVSGGGGSAALISAVFVTGGIGRELLTFINRRK